MTTEGPPIPPENGNVRGLGAEETPDAEGVIEGTARVVGDSENPAPDPERFRTQAPPPPSPEAIEEVRERLEQTAHEAPHGQHDSNHNSNHSGHGHGHGPGKRWKDMNRGEKIKATGKWSLGTGAVAGAGIISIMFWKVIALDIFGWNFLKAAWEERGKLPFVGDFLGGGGGGAKKAAKPKAASGGGGDHGHGGGH